MVKDEDITGAVETITELVNDNAVLYNKSQEFDDAVHALVLLHDEVGHAGAFRFCRNPVCSLFTEYVVANFDG